LTIKPLLTTEDIPISDLLRWAEKLLDWRLKQ